MKSNLQSIRQSLRVQLLGLQFLYRLLKQLRLLLLQARRDGFCVEHNVEIEKVFQR